MDGVKLVKKLALALLPVVIYFALFVYFEPYNYFGIKQSEYTGDSRIVRVRQFNEKKADTIILGDSRMAHFDMELVEEYTGCPVSNLSFGGASFNESMDLLEYAMEANPDIDTVYFGVSFYTLNQSYYKDRMSQIKTIAENPFAYMLNFNYNVEMLNEIRYFLKGETNHAEENIGKWKEEDYYYEDGTPRPYRENLEVYATTQIAVVCQNYTFDIEDIDRYIRLRDKCREKGITLYTVLPPMDDSIKDLVVDKMGIDKGLKDFIDLAGEHSVVLNYEYNDENPFGEDQFYDGFHLDGEKGLPVFTKMLFDR